MRKNTPREPPSAPVGLHTVAPKKEEIFEIFLVLVDRRKKVRDASPVKRAKKQHY